MAKPRYEQIADDLRGKIVRGELTPGDRLPSEQDLRTSWSVARATAVAALKVLRQEGLVESRQGNGTYVSARPAIARTASERYAAALRSGFAYTSGEHAKIERAEKEPAPEHVASALGVEAGDEVIHRVRVTFEGDTPTAMSHSWFTAEVGAAAPRLLARERIREGTTRYVSMSVGRAVTTAEDSLGARLASEEEAALLGLSTPLAVLETLHTVWDADGQALAYEEGLAPSGRRVRTGEYEMAQG